MSLLSKLVKNTITGAAVGAYNAYKTAEQAVQKQVDLAKLSELLEREENYEREVEHFDKADREKMLQMAKAFSMKSLAERSAKDKNTLNQLKHKYGLIQKN